MTRRAPASPPVELVPLDDDARDGRYRMIGDGTQFAVARWMEGGWEFASGVPVPFEPSGYYRKGQQGD